MPGNEDDKQDATTEKGLSKEVWQQIELDEPIVRGNKSIETISLRKPKSGELRRLALADVVRMEVDALSTLLPRITSPALTQHEVQAMDPADLMQCGTTVAGFLLPKEMRADG